MGLVEEVHLMDFFYHKINYLTGWILHTSKEGVHYFISEMPVTVGTLEGQLWGKDNGTYMVYKVFQDTPFEIKQKEICV